MNWVYSTLETRFYNFGGLCRVVNAAKGGMSKSETGLQSLGQGSREGVWNGEGQAGLGTRSSENRIKVCG